MDIGLILAAGATVVAVVVLVARRRGLRGHHASRSAVVATVLLALDLWLWDVALDGLWGPQRVLVAPLALANALLSFGVIHTLTGFGLHSDDKVFARSTGLYGGFRGALRDGRR